MKSLPITAGILASTLALMSAHTALAVPQRIVFRGFIDSTTSKLEPLPAGLQRGATVYGAFFYDPDQLEAFRENPDNPRHANYYTRDTAALGFWVRAGNWELASTPVPAGYPSQNGVSIDNDDGPYDALGIDCLNPGVWINGAAVEGGGGSFSLYFYDSTRTALSSDALPVPFPPLSAFATGHRVDCGAWSLDTVTGIFTKRYSFLTVLTELTADGAPPLQIEPLADGTMKLSWPLIVPGFSLQTAPSPESPDWTSVSTGAVQTATRNEVIVTTSTEPRFFRLHRN